MTLTRLLWSVHAECVVLFPEGVEVAAWCVPGSEDLSRATARALAARRMVVWPFHGVAAAGRSPDEAVGFLETGEKAAGIYLKALAAGGPGAVLGTEDLREIAAKFGVRPDETILHGPEPDPHPEGRRRTEEPS
jgi:rhamnulose-1-phosphate aldolase